MAVIAWLAGWLAVLAAAVLAVLAATVLAVQAVLGPVFLGGLQDVLYSGYAQVPTGPPHENLEAGFGFSVPENLYTGQGTCLR